MHWHAAFLREVLVEGVDKRRITQRFAAVVDRQVIQIDQLLIVVDQFILVGRRCLLDRAELLVEQVELFEQLQSVDRGVTTERSNAALQSQRSCAEFEDVRAEFVAEVVRAYPATETCRPFEE